MRDFESLYKRYYPQVYRYLMKLCRDTALAEELTQDTFFKAMKTSSEFRGECRFDVWLCQIAKNTYYRHAERSRRISDTPVEELELADPNDTAAAVEDHELSLRIHAVLHRLEEPYREVFWMRTFGELSFAEIASVHHKTESWARVTFHRAKMKIQEEMKNEV